VSRRTIVVVVAVSVVVLALAAVIACTPIEGEVDFDGKPSKHGPAKQYKPKSRR